MSAGFDLDRLAEKTNAWLSASVLTYDMLIETGLVLASFALALLVRALIAPHVTPLTERIHHYPRFAARLVDAKALLLPFLWASALFIADTLSTAVGYDSGLCRIVIKLLLAWMVIRTLAQMITHKIPRMLVAGVIWAIAALSVFGVLDIVSESLAGAGFTLGKFQITALGVIKGVLALTLLLYGSLLLASFIDARLSRSGLNAASRLLIGKMTRIVFIAAALLIAITTAGIDLSVLAVFSGAIGLGIGFGLQRNFSNMFSGLMLLVDQSIKPGDVVEVSDPSGKSSTFGWVTHMGGRYTEIVSRDNKSFLIPNEQLITQQVVNWSHGDTKVRIKVSFGVSYKADPHVAKAVAERATAQVARVVADPKPACHLVEFGESSLNFSLRFWITDAEKGVTNVQGDVMLALWDAFKAEGIDIPYPHREVYIHQPADETQAS